MKTMTNARFTTFLQSIFVTDLRLQAVVLFLCLSALMAADCSSIPKPSGVLLVQRDAVSPTENELMSRQDIQACVSHRQPAAAEQKPERLCFSGNGKVFVSLYWFTSSHLCDWLAAN